jgi:hypothetical protein
MPEKNHDWIPSTTNPRELICRNCHITNREFVEMRLTAKCDGKPVIPFRADEMQMTGPDKDGLYTVHFFQDTGMGPVEVQNARMNKETWDDLLRQIDQLRHR